jgi:O-antigen/teichoic acid export membrane protein
VTWNGLLTLAAMGGTMVLTYLFQVAMARSLSTREYGELSATLATLNVLTIPVFGLCMAVTRDVAATSTTNLHDLGRLVRPYAVRVAGVTLAGFAGLALLSSWLSGFLQLSSVSPLIYLALLVAMTNAVGTGRAILLGIHDFGSVGLNQVAEAFIRLVSGLTIAVAGLAATAGYAGYSLGLLVALLLATARIRMRMGHPRSTPGGVPRASPTSVSPSKHADISWAAIVLTGTFIVLLNMDLIVVKHFLPPDLAGQYAALSTLAKALFVITNAFDVVLFPLATAARASGSNGDAHLRRALFSIGLIVVPVLATYWLAAVPMVSLLFGQRYAGVAPLLFPYALAVALLGVATLIARYRLAVGYRVPSAALLGAIVIASGAFVLFHETLDQVVGVLLVIAFGTLALTLVGHASVGRSWRGT